MTSHQQTLMEEMAHWFQDQGWDYTLQADNTRLVTGFTTQKGAYIAIWQYIEAKALLSVQLLYPDPTPLSSKKVLQEINRVNAYRHPGYFLCDEASHTVLWIYEMFVFGNKADLDQWTMALFSGLAIMDHYFDLFQQEGINTEEVSG